MTISNEIEGMVYVELSKFKELQGNLKDLTETNYNKLKASIIDYGFIAPIFAWKQKDVYWIIDAHQRYRVLVNLKKDGYDIPKLPTVLIKANDKRDAKKKLLILNSKYGKMTAEGLYEFINEVNLEIDFDSIKDVLDFPDIDIDGFDLGFNKDVEVNEDNYEIPNEIETNIKTGDLIVFSKNGKELHRLLCGDSTKIEDVKKLMDGEKADSCITSPPYNQGGSKGDLFSHGKRIESLYHSDTDNKTKEEYFEFCQKILSNILSIINDTHSVVWNVSYNAKSRDDYGKIIFSEKNPFTVKETIVWDKGGSINLPQKGIYSRRAEMVFVMSNYEGYLTSQVYGDCRWNIWQTKRQNQLTNHKATYPIEYAERAINELTNKYNLIFDPFLGSGTTMVVAHQLNRKCYGIEIDNKYCQVIIDRMLNLDKDLEVTINDK